MIVSSRDIQTANSAETMTVDEFSSRKYRDLATAFPFQSVDEMQNFLFELFVFSSDPSRLPILAVLDPEDPSAPAKILIQTQPPFQHRHLGNILASENSARGDMNDEYNPNVAFSTSFERVTDKKPSEGPYLQVNTAKEEMYVIMSKGSTYYKKGFTAEGQDAIKAIFEQIPEVKFVGFDN